MTPDRVSRYSSIRTAAGFAQPSTRYSRILDLYNMEKRGPIAHLISSALTLSRALLGCPPFSIPSQQESNQQHPKCKASAVDPDVLHCRGSAIEQLDRLIDQRRQNTAQRNDRPTVSLLFPPGRRIGRGQHAERGELRRVGELAHMPTCPLGVCHLTVFFLHRKNRLDDLRHSVTNGIRCMWRQ